MYYVLCMIRLANPSSSTKTFVSPVLFQPLNSGDNYTDHVINHDLGVTPDLVTLYVDDGRIMYSIFVSGANTFGWHVDLATPTSVTVRIFRYGAVEFYAIISSLANQTLVFP